MVIVTLKLRDTGGQHKLNPWNFMMVTPSLQATVTTTPQNNRFNDGRAKTVALHVRFTFWYISLPSFAKQQREMTTF